MSAQNRRAYAQGCDDFLKGNACRGAKGVEGPQCPEKRYINCCAFCRDFDGGVGCKDCCPILLDLERT